ncbi:MAG: HAD-IA family hydrolase [Pseudomonadota bacterium]
MSAGLRLAVFDVDGTLVDSQAHIVGAMGAAFASVGLRGPSRAEILGVIGLSLPNAFARLAPGEDAETLTDAEAAYRAAFMEIRHAQGAGAAPLYPGAVEVLRSLASDPAWAVGVATGKSRRGLQAILEMHDLTDIFDTLQTADGHPSKPHPAMLEAALEDCGMAAGDAVMIGDTTFDMEMARSAGVTAIGVDWGYHAAERLLQSGAACVISDFQDLIPRLDHHR